MRGSWSRLIAWLMYIQAFTLVGFFSLRKSPYFVQKVDVDIHSLIFATSDAASILIAVTLVMTGHSLTLRRRSAWVLAIWLQSALIFLSLGRSLHRILFHHHSEHYVVHAFRLSHLLWELIILGLLVYRRRDFRTIPNRHTYRRALRIAIQATLLSMFLGVLIVYFNRNSFEIAPNFFQAVRLSIKGFFGISDSYTYVSNAAQSRLEILLGSLGALSLTTTMWQLFKPIEKKIELDREDEATLRKLLTAKDSGDSLGYFALRDNKSVIWSRNRKAAIAYSVTNGVMLTTGDPIGDRESWPDAISQFIEVAELHAWIPAVYGCSEGAGLIWVRETGFSSLEIGDEAIIEVADFTLDGSAMKNVRQMVARMKRAGITTHTAKVSELTEDQRKLFVELSHRWRRGGDERGFSMALGRFADLRDPDVTITWSEQNHEPVGLLQFVPWASNGLSLDIMRRSESVESGINEELITSTIDYARANGIERISLNFATFRSIFERGSKLGAGPITRFNYKILKFLSRFAQMESLYRFNAKFRPVWEPRFVLYPGAKNLARITFAILTIESFWPPFKVGKKWR